MDGKSILFALTLAVGLAAPMTFAAEPPAGPPGGADSSQQQPPRQADPRDEELQRLLRVAEANLNEAGAFKAREALQKAAEMKPEAPALAELSARAEKFLYVENAQQMKFARIDAGAFRMGSHPEHRGHRGNETLHQVTLTKRFWLGTTEVTNAQFSAVMGFNLSLNQDAELPATNMTWLQAIEFCEKLGNRPEERRAGRTYRLPTEAEWEYACKAGSEEPFSGSDSVKDLGWSSLAQAGRKRESVPKPVAQKKPNAWGLFDMHGNVAEFCQDLCPRYTDAPETDPAGPLPNEARRNTPVAVRGGSIASQPEQCRSADRGTIGRQRADSLCGFRVVLVMPAAADAR